MPDLIEFRITDRDAAQVHSVRFLGAEDLSLLLTVEQANALALRLMQAARGGEDNSNN